MTVNQIQTIVDRKKAQYDLLKRQLEIIDLDIAVGEQLVTDMVEARNIISEASRVTQEQFKEYVEQLVTLAIQSVFVDEGYKFLVNFALQGNRSQINLLVQQGDKEAYVPEDEQGGGLLDIVSFALRIVLWGLETPKSRNTLIMDEPMKFCGALTERAAQMMKEISHKMGIQMIIVTHDDRLKEIADRSWEVSRVKGGISVVRGLYEEVKPVIVRRRIK
jgi:DNA repair exonuclease SbcCD ATPase subunit